jgi:hypothetical protein
VITTKKGGLNVTSLPNPVSRVNPNALGETNADREYLNQVLRAAIARTKLVATQIETIACALRQRAVGVHDAIAWAKEDDVFGILQFGPAVRSVESST